MSQGATEMRPLGSTPQPTAQPETAESSGIAKFFSKTSNIIITAVAGIGAALVITGIVLAIVYAPSSSDPEIVPSPTTTPTTRPTTRTTTTADDQTTELPTTTRSTVTTTRDFIYERLNSRIDCVPWLKNKTGVDVAAECAKNLACEYESVDNNVLIPSCYYDTDLVQVDFLTVEKTRLGESYLISADAGLDLTQSRILRIDFEYLEDTVLRFKVRF